MQIPTNAYDKNHKINKNMCIICATMHKHIDWLIDPNDLIKHLPSEENSINALGI